MQKPEAVVQPVVDVGGDRSGTLVPDCKAGDGVADLGLDGVKLTDESDALLNNGCRAGACDLDQHATRMPNPKMVRYRLQRTPAAGLRRRLFGRRFVFNNHVLICSKSGKKSPYGSEAVRTSPKRIYVLSKVFGL